MKQVIPEAGIATVNVKGRAVPFSVCVSGAGAKSISISMDGENYIPAQLDIETDQTAGLGVFAPLASVQIEAPAGSEYEVF